MSRTRVAVLKVVSQQLSVTQSAAEYGFSRRHLHRLLARYRSEGLEALEPRSRRPASNAKATSSRVRERVIELRLKLSADGCDAGPVTIAWHLEREGLRVPSTSTIRRILSRAGLITPEPRKRPRLHHLGAGIEHARKRVLAFADDHKITVADLTTGEVLSVHLIDPTNSYWRNQNKEPGRWPSSPN